MKYFVVALFAMLVAMSAHAASVIAVDSEEMVGENGFRGNAIDGDPNTKWHSLWKAASPPHPHFIILDLGGVKQVSGFTHLPRQDASWNGTTKDYEFYVSETDPDPKQLAASGSLTQTRDKTTVSFTPTPARFVKFVALSEVNGNPWTAIAELEVISSEEPVDLFSGKVSAAWTHDYKSTPDEDGNIVDVDVYKYRVYKDGQVIREVPDDDSGTAETLFVFPDEIQAAAGSEWCVSVDAVKKDEDGNDVASEKSDEGCILLVSEEPPPPVTVPVPPSGVLLKVLNEDGTLRLELVPQ